jgi:hypothetical protein
MPSLKVSQILTDENDKPIDVIEREGKPKLTLAIACILALALQHQQLSVEQSGKRYDVMKKLKRAEAKGTETLSLTVDDAKLLLECAAVRWNSWVFGQIKDALDGVKDEEGEA